MKIFTLFLVLAFAVGSTAFTNIKSTQGKISFDVESDGAPEATLNSDGLAIGTQLPSANLHVKGTVYLENELSLGLKTISSDTILSETTEASLLLVNTSSDNINLTLPNAANVSGRIYLIKKTSSENELRVKSDQNIDGLDSDMILTQSGYGLPQLKVVSDGSNWLVLDKSEDVNQLIATDNLIAWYKFDTVDTDSLTDSSENQLHGTLNNGLTISDNTSVGRIGQAMTFDGTDDNITMGSSYTRPTTEFTICFWFYRASTQQMEIVQDFAWNGGNAYGYLVKCSSTGTITVFAGDGSGSSNANTSDNAELGEWTHITAIYNNGISTVYRNGVLQTMSDSTNNASITYVGTSGLMVSRNSTTLSVEGKLDDLRIYNTALSEAAVQNIFLQGF